MSTRRNKIIIVSGERNAGKSYFCAEVVRTAQMAGLDAAGMISPAVVQDGVRQRIDALDIRSGIRKPLAYAKAFTGEGTVTEHWHFDDDTLAWGNSAFEAASPCDVLVIDEIGPLELRIGRGWSASLAALDKRAYTYAFVVVRPELIEEAIQRWRPTAIITLSLRNRRWMAYAWRLRIALLKIFPWI